MMHRDSFTDNFTRSTLVFVTDQFQCERSISAGYALAEASRTTLVVINIADPAVAGNAAAIEHLYQVTRDYGASMSIVYADDDVTGIMSRMLIANQACHVITGVPGSPDSPAPKLWRIHPAVNYYTVSPDGTLNAVPLEAKQINR